MADKIVLVDTSILIDYYRRTEKEKRLIDLASQAIAAAEIKNKLQLSTLNRTREIKNKNGI